MIGSQARSSAEESPLTGRRVAARARLALPGTIETVKGVRRMVLRNLSTTGAMLEVGELPAVGSDAVLRCGALDCIGVVVWARFRWCGVHFDEPLDQRQVVGMRVASDEAARAPQQDLQDAARRWAQGGVAR